MTDLMDAVVMRRIETERRFAAAAFLRSDTAREQCGWLDPKLFYDDRYRKFWQELRDHGDNVKAANAANLFGQLAVDSGMDEVFYGRGVAGFADQVAQEAWFYALGDILPKLAQSVATGDMENSRRLVDQIVNETPAFYNGVPDAGDIGLDFIESLEEENISIPSGIGKIDRAYGGFWRKNFYVICARPSVGKTALQLQCARGSVAAGYRVLFSSLEMSARDLWARMACGMVRIPYRDVIAKRINPDEKQKIIDAASQLLELYSGKLFIDDNPNTTTDTLWQTVATVRPDIVYTDHLRLFRDYDRSLNEVQRLGLISRNHKRIAKEFDIPVVAAAQLNRNVESRTDKEPILSDLRDSGQIEEDADVVIGMHRNKEDLDKPREISPANLIGLKFRNGPSNIRINLEFDGLAQWFNEPQF